MLNTTFNLKPVSDACWNWCSEQTIIHQGNATINNLFVVAIAMGVLAIFTLSADFSEEISKALGISEETLEHWGDISIFFAFMLLAGFLIYYTLGS